MLLLAIRVFSGITVATCATVKWVEQQHPYGSEFYNISRIMRGLYRLDHNPYHGNTTVKEAIKRWQTIYESKNIPEPRLSVLHILAHVLDVGYINEVVSKPYRNLTEGQELMFQNLCQVRLARMPVQYIIKEWDFRDLQLSMHPPVFIPRPETEGIIDLIVEEVPKFKTFLEVGCGTGAISLALMHAFPKVKGIAIDSSILACRLTDRNIHNMDFWDTLKTEVCELHDDGTLNVTLRIKQFDLIVSNPPYVPTKEMSKLPLEITKFEDLRALDGGEDGLRVVKALLLLTKTALKSNGHLVLEVDTTHPPIIKKMVEDNSDYGLAFIKHFKDVYERDRFVLLKKI